MLVATDATDPPIDHPRGWIGLEVIAAYKFIKAATLIAAGLGTLGMLNAGWNDAAQDWLERLALASTHHLVAAMAGHALPYFDAAGPRQFLELAVGAFVYSAVFLVEGVGLWRCRRWAEYLTIVVTASLFPIELFALHRRVTAFRVGALVTNVLVIAYLVWQIRATRPVTRTT